MSETGEGRETRWLIRLAGLLWLVSFFLPAARLGARGGRAALGLLAALYAGYVLPAAFLRLAAGPPVPFLNAVYALLAGLLFLVLLAQNGLMLYLVARPRSGRLLRRLALLAALLVWAVPFVDYGRLYPVLGLEKAAIRLELGYFVWALSFVLLAAGLWWGQAAESSKR